MLEVVQIPVLDDNYVYLLHESESKATAVIDPAVVAPVMEAATARGWNITHILNTHHHFDHVGGNEEIQKATGAIIVGAACDAARIPGIQVEVSDGDEFHFGKTTAKIFEVPGHTSGHIAYWFADGDALFCGDALFSLGCGRLFEGTPAQMWKSLSKFSELPDTAQICCAHEYTQANAAFAVTVDPDNAALAVRVAEIETLRSQNKPTVPSLLGLERATNPFLRAEDKAIAAHLGLENADAVSVFTEIRLRKDNF